MSDDKKKRKIKGNELALSQNEIDEGEVSIDLYDLLLKLLDKWRWIALCALVGAVAMLAYTLWFVTPQYKATSGIYVVSGRDSIINVSDFQISNYLAQDYIEVFGNWELHEEVLQDLERRQAAGEEQLKDIDISKYTYSMLNKMISVSNPSNTRIIYITATSTDRNEAQVLANTYASVGKEFVATRMDTTAPKEFEHALTPTSPSSPNITRNTLLGFILGALLAVAVITLRYIVDDYVRTADDVEKYLHIPTLGTIMLQKESDDDRDTSSRHKKKGDGRYDDDFE